LIKVNAQNVGNAYRLDLAKHMQVHPVFSLEKLRRAATTPPLEGQIADKQEPVQGNGPDAWEAEDVYDAMRWLRRASSALI
jgi:uncharacterized protein YtpQ (UPF0354 family)